MEFKPQGEFSKLISARHQPMVNINDVSEMICNEYLMVQRAHHIVVFENTYDDSLLAQYGSIPDRIKKIEQAFNQSQTIVIKELEHWSSAIENTSNQLGAGANVHLYFSPVKGTSFGWHQDDRDVFILMQLGQKTIEVEEIDGSLSVHHLKPGFELYIPYGLKHRALPSDVVSIHLSFGYWPKGVSIKSSYPSIPLELDFKL